MKRSITYSVCVLVGIGIGWYFGYTRPVTQKQRELLEQGEYFREHTREFDADVAVFEKMRAEYAKQAEPWMASSASIALGALKDLKTNDLDGAKYRLAAIVAAYYRGHSRDGDTNLIKSIVTFAASDTAFSNAFYGPLK